MTVERQEQASAELSRRLTPPAERPTSVDPLDVLRRLTEQMTANRDTGEVLRAITRALVDHAGVAVARIWLIATDAECPVCREAPDPSRDAPALHLCASAGVYEDIVSRHLPIRLGTKLSRFLLENRTPVVMNDVDRLTPQQIIDLQVETADQAPNVEPQWVYDNGFKAYAGYPLIFRDELVGSLGLFCRRRLEQSEFEHIGIFAAHAAIVLRGAQLFAEVDRLRDRLLVENAYLKEEIRSEQGFAEIVGASTTLRAVLRKLGQVAPTDSTVLIYGETGTGKELIARAIHNLSPRRDRALVKVNCGAMTPSLVESELFGHEKGAFTGALQRRIGRFELADKGTLFMDEVGELPLDTQVKLLRVLQEQEFERVGSSKPTRVDVRLVAATNRDLEREVAEGRFRPDLFYRLNVFPLRVPPLRERSGDIPQLAQHFVAQCARKLGKPLEGIARGSMPELVRYPWPGNIRELQNVIERACVLARGPVVEITDALAMPRAAGPSSSAELPTLEAVERAHIRRVLEETKGRVHGPRGAAVILGVHPNTLRSRMQRLGMTKD